jgi:hypothetical protein
VAADDFDGPTTLAASAISRIDAASAIAEAGRSGRSKASILLS